MTNKELLERFCESITFNGRAEDYGKCVLANVYLDKVGDPHPDGSPNEEAIACAPWPVDVSRLVDKFLKEIESE